MTPQEPASRQANLQAAGLMVLSAVFFTTHVATAKFLTADMHPGTLTFFRSLIGLFLLLPFIIREGPSVFKTTKPGLLIMRSLFATTGFLFALTAVADLPLSQFNAISFARTLFVIMLAALILRESIGPRRWMATGLGFLGVVLITSPFGGVSYTPDQALAAIYALISTIGIAVSIVTVKFLSRDHSPLSLVVFANIFTAILTTPFLFFGFEPPSLYGWGVIILMAASGVIGQSCYVTAMSKGDASFVAPFDYIRLPMTLSVDALVFKVLPSVWIWPGTILIILSTLYITLRDAARKDKS